MGKIEKIVKPTIKQKVEILKKLNKGVSVNSICQQYNLHKSSVYRIKKQENALKKFVTSTESGTGKRCTLKEPEFPNMEKALYNWFMAQRERNVPLSADIVKSKARQFHAKYEHNSTSFNASDGWFKNFKKRHGIRFLKICGEKLSNKPHLIDPFMEILEHYILKHGLTNDQIYNADESGLYYRLLPNHTLVHCNEPSAPGRKICKDRVTFLTCANATGLHKLKLLVIGKSKNPRVLKNFTNNPVTYKASKNAWMTSTLFKDWFHLEFVPQVKEYLHSKGLPEKALLLLDNATCHPIEELKSDDGLIVAMCLPPNCTALIQPMDQNIINVIKMHYKKSLLMHLIEETGSDLDLKLKTFNLKIAIQILAASWLRIPSSSIKKSWNAVLISKSGWNEEDDMPLNLLQNQIREENEMLSSLSVLLENICSGSNFSNTDVDQWVNESYLMNEHSEDEVVPNEEIGEEDCEEYVEKPKINIDNAISSFNTCIEWAIENDMPLHQTMTLYELRDCAVGKKLSIPKKQLKISHFFKET